MADIALETDDIDYLSAVMSLWDNIVNKKYYLTGGIGSGETSEEFGPNYSLRNSEGIYVNLFIGSTATVEDVAGTDVDIVQKTDYPWSGSVVIIVNPSVDARACRLPRLSGITSASFKGFPPADDVYFNALSLGT
jgi:DUF1680 family protein